MKLKIISDGTQWGTKVINAETGEMVEHVTRADVHPIIPGEPVSVTLTIEGVQLDMVAEESSNAA